MFNLSIFRQSPVKLSSNANKDTMNMTSKFAPLSTCNTSCDGGCVAPFAYLFSYIVYERRPKPSCTY
jgi:hypothetical protein